MASQQQIDANRKNAQKSTGPKNPEGKAAVCRNAFSHGLTADLVCINGEDMDEFDATRQSFEDELKPVGPVQALLVQRIVMAAWRLERLRLIEGGIFQLRAYDDTRQLQTEYKDVPPRTRLAFLYLRDVRGPNALALLGRYEARIERSFYRALHELQRLWLIEATRYKVLPLDDRMLEKFNPDTAGRPVLIRGKTQLLFGGMGRLSENCVLNLKNKSHSVTAEIVVPEKGAEGVIIAQGANIGGWSLYAKGGKLKYCYNWGGFKHFMVEGGTPIPAGDHQVRMEFAYAGGGPGKGG